MTTFTETLTFIKAQARITSTDQDTRLGYAINEARRTVLGKDFFPQSRTAATQVLTAGTQDYALPADFNIIAEDSLVVYTTGTTYYSPVIVTQQPDADLWEAFQSGALPGAAQIIKGTANGLRKLRLMPNFTATGQTLGYVYWAHPADVSGSEVLGSPDLCDAVAWSVLAGDKDYSRDNGNGQVQADYQLRYQSALKRFRSSLLT